MDDKLYEGLRFDFYGELLSDKQKTILDYYYNDDYSLAEIGALLEMTRQGVFDAVKRANRQMEDFEAKLGLLNRHLKNRDLLRGITDEITKLTESEFVKNNPEIKSEIITIKNGIDEIIEGY